MSTNTTTITKILSYTLPDPSEWDGFDFFISAISVVPISAAVVGDELLLFAEVEQIPGASADDPAHTHFRILNFFMQTGAEFADPRDEEPREKHVGTVIINGEVRHIYTCVVEAQEEPCEE